MKCGVLAIFLLLSLMLQAAHAQDEPITNIAAAPCKEIYDLLEDRRGFMWIGDNLGVRRYDGVSFTSFSTSSQSSISMSGLCEDSRGRIWCQNFSGQIFYIEHEKMHLLEAYDYKIERAYPHIALCGDELVATSLKGLFICDTKTLQCHSLLLDVGATSLCVIGNKTILFCNSKFYVYQKGKALVQLPVNEGKFGHLDLRSIVLCTASDGKHCFASTDRRTQLYVLSLHNNQLEIEDIKPFNSFINTVSVKNNEVWVHTKTGSYSLMDTAVVARYNLSCILKDRSGNRWYSSLEKGLLVNYARENRLVVKSAASMNGDFIRCIEKGETYFVAGSQQGKIYIADSTQKIVQTYDLGAGVGAVEKIQLMGSGNFYVECSVGLYLVQPLIHTIRCVNKVLVARDLAIVDSTLYAGTPRGLLHPDLRTLTEEAYNLGTTVLDRLQRCRAVRYDSLSKSLFIAYADGLFRLQNNQLYPVLYQNKPLYVSSLEYYKGKMCVGTFNGNFIVIQNNNLTEYKPDNGSEQTPILRMKLCGDHVWLLKTSGVSAFDLKDEVFHYNRELAHLSGGDIYDLEETKGSIYFCTSTALYQIQLQDNTPLQQPALYSLYTIINNRDTVFSDHTKFSPNASSLSFYLAAPWLHNNSDVRIRYALLNTNKKSDTVPAWNYLAPNSRVVQFNSLKPGSYSLRIEAGVNGDFAYATSHIDYQFSIWKRWYNHGWFYLLLSAAALLLLLLFYKYRIRQLTKIEKLRRQISSDLHDEIGSTISSINIYSQLIKNGNNPFDYIDIIQENTVQVINNLDDVVWNINPKNDTLAQLVNRMKLFALPYLEDNGIEVSFDADIEKDTKALSPEVRTDCYLVFKEAITNMVKHADCSACQIQLYQKKKNLKLQVKDNGKGFNVDEAALHRNGLTTMRVRTKQLRGTLAINSSPGQGTEIVLTCRLSLL